MFKLQTAFLTANEYLLNFITSMDMRADAVLFTGDFKLCKPIVLQNSYVLQGGTKSL